MNEKLVAEIVGRVLEAIDARAGGSVWPGATADCAAEGG